MSTGVTCTVLLDGKRAADGSPGDGALDPIILDDLQVVWGRSDTMSQPAVDSCSFAVMDQLGGQAFLDQYRTGLRVDVLAHGDTYPDPDVDTFVDGGFETTAVTWSATGGTAARSSSRVHTGASSLAFRPAVAGASLLLAPDVLQPSGTNPDAWDGIATTSTGQTWSATVSLWLPPGASATVRAALFTGPYATAGTPAGSPQVVEGDGTWQTVTATHAIQVDDRWVGLWLEVNPTGSSWDELPPALTWDTVDASRSWDDLGTMYVDDAQVVAPGEGVGRGVLVFAGRITGMASSWDDSTGSPVVKVTANGFTADLQNRNVGDEPWAVETVAARATRILELTELPISIDIDSSLDDVLLSYRDVDSQGANGLLQSIAVSVDGVLWPAVHQSIGPYLRLEDPSLRAALLQLALVGGAIVITQGDPDIGFDLSACAILRDPVTWIQDVSDLVTRVAVQWKVQGVDDDGTPKTSDATELVVDAELELEYGTRRVQIGTELQAAADAQDVAQRVLARTSPSTWRAEGLTIDDEDVAPGGVGTALVLDLLDGTSRIGAALVLNDLPIWSPAGASAGVYLEGGTYRYVGGRWVLELVISAAGGGVGASAAWDELDPAWSWDAWSPDITWNDLRGVAA